MEDNLRNSLLILLALMGLFVGSLLLAGQRDFGLKSWDDRLAAVEARANHPHLEISGRNTIYAGERLILVEKIEDGKD